MKTCEYCNKEHSGSYGIGRFCNSKCAHGFSTHYDNSKELKESICIKCGCKILINKRGNNKQKCNDCKKVYIKKDKNKIIVYYKICEYCKQEFLPKDFRVRHCSSECAHKNVSNETRKKLSIIGKKRCKNINERLRLKNIGRKGGFGKKGYTNNGTRYESNFEKLVFEFLEENNIDFIPHKPILNTSKTSDIYLINIDTWIELDGINREKRKQWLGNDYIYWKNKLKLYKKNKLKYKIIYNFNEFKKFILVL